LGDEGSGYALALAALRAVVRAADGAGEPTALANRLLELLQVREVRDLVPLLQQGGLDRPAVAGLAPAVLELAAGDPAARAVVEAQAARLAATALAAVRKLGFADQPFPLALAGGLLVESARYRELVLAALRSAGARPGPVALVREPAEGAVRLALEGLARDAQAAPA
jgi:N-acetylglucosamine kinase-like BadF-type ATPase